MSEKKNKRQIKIPSYKVENQMDFLTSVCQDFKFDVRTLITLILADWIYTFQLCTSKAGGNAQVAFYSYLESTVKVADNLKKLRTDLLAQELAKKEFQNESK